MNAADRLKDARQAASYTQADLAEALGVTPSAISQWETNLSLPDVNRIAALSIILKRSIDWILRGVDVAFVPPVGTHESEWSARIRRLEYWAWGQSLQPPAHLPELSHFIRGDH